MMSTILYPHEGGSDSLGMHQVGAIRSAIRSDDRFTWVPVTTDDAALSDIGTSVATAAARAEVLVRTSRTNRFDASNEMSKLLENESIPQYLWPAAKPFADWLSCSKGLLALEAETTAISLEGASVLEIGSGAGLCGFAAAAHCGPSLVVVSDCSPVAVAMLEESRLHNEESGAIPIGRVRVAALKWGDDDALRRLLEALGLTHFDVVIGSDIFYFRSSLSAGLSTAYKSLTGCHRPGSPSTPPPSTKPGLFVCSSFVRSQRMDEDIDTIPQTFGFTRKRVHLLTGNTTAISSSGGGLSSDDSASATDADDGDGGLRVYAWTTAADATQERP